MIIGGLVGEHIIEFLAVVGLPGPTFTRSVPELYDQLQSGDLDDTTVCETVRKEHGCKSSDVLSTAIPLQYQITNHCIAKASTSWSRPT